MSCATSGHLCPPENSTPAWVSMALIKRRMEMLVASTTIAAPEPETEPLEEPCYVQQQQDAEDTVPCSGDQALLNELLRLMGFDVPAPELPEEYSTQIKIKPKDGYTNLNISFSGNVTTDGGKWDQSDGQQTISISSADFVPSGGGGYVDIAAKLKNIVETDTVSGLRWVGSVYDNNLSEMIPKPGVTIDSKKHLPLSQAVNGELLVTVSEAYQIFDIKVSPEEEAGENAYQSSVIVETDGCEAQPTRYEINVPECYPNSWLDKYGWPGSDDNIGDAIVDDQPPKFVEPSDLEKEWCVCGNHRLQGVYPKSAEPDDISNICYSGPCDQITEPDCVPDDREEGDEYC